MRTRRLSISLPLLVVLLSLVFLLAAMAQDAPAADEGPKATTLADPTIDLGDLELQLIPLDKDELQIELDAWLGLVKAKAKEISAAELAVKRQNREINAREDAAAAAKDAQVAVKKAQESGDA